MDPTDRRADAPTPGGSKVRLVGRPETRNATPKLSATRRVSGARTRVPRTLGPGRVRRLAPLRAPKLHGTCRLRDGSGPRLQTASAPRRVRSTPRLPRRSGSGRQAGTWWCHRELGLSRMPQHLSRCWEVHGCLYRCPTLARPPRTNGPATPERGPNVGVFGWPNACFDVYSSPGRPVVVARGDRRS